MSEFRQTNSNNQQEKTEMKTKIGKLVAVAIMALASLTTTTSAQQSQSQPIDSELVAKAFLRKAKTTRYEGNFGFDRYVNNVKEVPRINGSFEMTPDGAITRLWIGEKEIALDKPLLTLPVNTWGTTVDFYCNAYGYSADNENVTYSNFHANLLKPGDPINLLINPAGVHKFVAFALPDGVSADDIQLEFKTKWGTSRNGYNEYRKGFDVWLDPLEGLAEYRITDGTGNVYQREILNPLEEVPPVSQGSAIGFNRIGGVVELPDERSTGAYNQQLDSTVVRNGNLLSAKVYYKDLAGGFIEIYHNGGLEYGSTIEVFDLADNGDSVFIQSAVVGQPGWPIITPGIHTKVIVTVIGTLNSWGQENGGFGLSFYSYEGAYNPPQPEPQQPTSGGGGGESIPTPAPETVTTVPVQEF